jgi:hypothetical protein
MAKNFTVRAWNNTSALEMPANDLPALQKVQAGEVTKSAHPARFSPDDK